MKALNRLLVVAAMLPLGLAHAATPADGAIVSDQASRRPSLLGRLFSSSLSARGALSTALGNQVFKKKKRISEKMNGGKAA